MITIIIMWELILNAMIQKGIIISYKRQNIFFLNPTTGAFI
jgi:hypothetical protein